MLLGGDQLVEHCRQCPCKMGELRKAQLARLIALAAAACMNPHPTIVPPYSDSAAQFNAALHGLIWPKVLWDFILPSTNILVTPIPYLQIANLVGAILVFVLEWPCWPGLSAIGLLWRCLATVAAALPALLLYQGTNAGLYHLISAVLYIRAHQQEAAR